MSTVEGTQQATKTSGLDAGLQLGLTQITELVKLGTQAANET